MQHGDSSPSRLVYLDWIRVAAFGLLMLYHVGMFYVTWDWHVKSAHASHALEPLMLLTNPWRLTLLFLVSGAATRFMADKLSVGALAGRRLRPTRRTAEN
jgi:glucan biosynthesis protein C